LSYQLSVGFLPSREWQDRSRVSSQYLVVRFRFAVRAKSLPLVALVRPPRSAAFAKRNHD